MGRAGLAVGVSSGNICGAVRRKDKEWKIKGYSWELAKDDLCSEIEGRK